MDPLPPAFTRTVTGLFGPEGVAWLAALPALLERCAQRWSLSIGPPVADLSINYVAPAARADGSPAILKLCVPNHEYRAEVEALRCFGGQGAVHLLASAPEDGALLLERIVPGTPLWDASEEEAMAAAVSVMRRFWRTPPATHSFPTVADWASGLAKLRRRYEGGTGPLPTDLVDLAEGLFAELLADAAEPVLLHGDLHHGNILRAEREPYLAIDPKGVVGDPAFEMTAFMLNPSLEGCDEAGVRRIFACRLDAFSEMLGVDRERLRGFSIARAVLSAWWSVEDHDDGSGAIARAGILAKMG